MYFNVEEQALFSGVVIKVKHHIMAKDYATGFYSSKKWKELRKQVAEESFFICTICGKPTYSNQGIVHHKTPITEENIDDTNITLNKNNLMYVCRNCHEALHKQTDKRNPYCTSNISSKRIETDKLDDEFIQLMEDLKDTTLANGYKSKKKATRTILCDVEGNLLYVEDYPTEF